MDQQRPRLLESLQSLRGAIGALSDNISGSYSATPESRPSFVTQISLDLERLDAAIGDLQTRCPNSHQNSDHDAPENPLILQSCLDIVHQLDHGLGNFSLAETLDIQLKLAWFRIVLTYPSLRSMNPQATLLYLHVLRSQPPTDFKNHIDSLSLGREEALPTVLSQDGEDGEQVTLLKLTSWITPFLRLDSHEPGEYYRERNLVLQKELLFKGYSDAAVGWPRHAERFWASVQPQISSLFSPSNRFNFIHWYLQYSRSKWPQVFGWDAPSAGPLIELTNALCQGTIQPLHVAASLGLPSLCEHLLSLGADVGQTGALGTPLWCALLGPDVLLHRLARHAWQLYHDADYICADRPDTIKRLVNSEAPLESGFPILSSDSISLCSAAFWVALHTADESILRRVMVLRSGMDLALRDLLDNLEESDKKIGGTKTLARLLTVLLDHILTGSPDLDMVTCIDDTMARLQLDLTPAGFNGLLPISATDLKASVMHAIVTDDALSLRRVVMDPRFDPNPEPSDPEGRESLLHVAIGNDFIAGADILICAGANLRYKDSSGRTAVMVVESAEMLEMLVLKHGASTTDRDHLGRTIWHMAAATNDGRLLRWLCENDPCKEENLNTTTKKGDTPLAEAFICVKTLDEIPYRKSESLPHAARVLLQHCVDESTLCSSIPLPHLAAEWGDLELVEGLYTLGADFTAIDELGSSTLHHLNRSATNSLIMRLKVLCKDIPALSQGSGSGIFTAETILLNTRMLKSSTGGELSSHPSCRNNLTTRAYSNLLTPEVIGGHDRNGGKFWLRFCENVLMRFPDGDPDVHQSEREVVDLALQCALEAGALSVYEEQTGKPGILCFDFRTMIRSSGFSGNNVLTPGVSQSWNVRHFAHFLQAILEATSPPSLKSFIESTECQNLLAEVCLENEVPLLEALCKAGIRPRLSWIGYKGYSVIDAAIINGSGDLGLGSDSGRATNVTVLDILLAHLGPEGLNRQSGVILNSLVGDGRVKHIEAKILETFLDNGLHLDPEEDGRSMLAESIKNGYMDMAQELIRRGARLDLGRYGFNGLIAAAREGDCSILARIIEADIFSGGKFPWGCMVKAPGWPPRNALHEAAARGHAEFLRAALSPGGLKPYIDVVTNEGAPIHLAVKIESMKMIKDLIDSGADLTLRDTNSSLGFTPLHHACYSASRDLIEVLVKNAPEVILIKDNRGRTPLGLAKSLGNDTALEVFEKFGQVSVS